MTLTVLKSAHQVLAQCPSISTCLVSLSYNVSGATLIEFTQYIQGVQESRFLTLPQVVLMQMVNI